MHVTSNGTGNSQFLYLTTIALHNMVDDAHTHTGSSAQLTILLEIVTLTDGSFERTTTRLARIAHYLIVFVFLHFVRKSYVLACTPNSICLCCCCCFNSYHVYYLFSGLYLITHWLSLFRFSLHRQIGIREKNFLLTKSPNLCAVCARE